MERSKNGFPFLADDGGSVSHVVGRDLCLGVSPLFSLVAYLLFPSAHRFIDGRSARATAVASVQTKEDGRLKSPCRHTLRSTAALGFLVSLFLVVSSFLDFDFCGSYWVFG